MILECNGMIVIMVNHVVGVSLQVANFETLCDGGIIDRNDYLADPIPITFQPTSIVVWVN